MVNCADHAMNFDNRGFHTDPEKDCVHDFHRAVNNISLDSFLPDVIRCMHKEGSAGGHLFLMNLAFLDFVQMQSEVLQKI